MIRRAQSVLTQNSVYCITDKVSYNDHFTFQFRKAWRITAAETVSSLSLSLSYSLEDRSSYSSGSFFFVVVLHWIHLPKCTLKERTKVSTNLNFKCRATFNVLFSDTFQSKETLLDQVFHLATLYKHTCDFSTSVGKSRG